MSAVYLSAFGVAAGEPCPISELAPEIGEAEVARLRAGGLERFRRSVQRPWRLAAGAARETLAEAPGGQVDLVVYVTDSYWHADFLAVDPGRLLHELDLPGAALVSATAQGCANAGQGLRTALAYLRSGLADSGLVVCTDVCRQGARLLSSGASVLSDAAVSCLVTRQAPDRGYRLAGVGAASVPWNATADPVADKLGILKGTAHGVAAAAEALGKDSGIAAADYRHVITNNYVREITRTLATLAGLPADRVYRDNLADYAHCFSGDGFLALAALERDGALSPADRVALLDSAHSFWGMTALEVL